MPAIAGIHHVALSVTDLERSAAWYRELLGLVEVLRAEDEGVVFAILADPAAGLVVGLRQFESTADGATFSHLNPGMDHLSFAVSDRAELDAWEQTLRERSITFTPVVDTPLGQVIAFRDPDNIQLELWLPAG